MKCALCNFTCKECDKGRCTICAKNRIFKNKECICPSKHYSVEGNPLCLPCDYTCNQCSGGDPNDCTEAAGCPSGREYF